MVNFPRLTMRNINRLVLLMSLAAPIVYLFGTQFTALAGAHGEEVIAQAPETVNHIELPNTAMAQGVQLVLADGSTRLDSRFLTTDYLPIEGNVSIMPHKVSDSTTVQVWICHYDSNKNWVSGANQIINNETLVSSSQITINPVGKFYRVSLYMYQDFDGMAIYSSLYPDFSYSSSLFGEMFVRDNFLVKWGQNSVSENPVGFAPIGTLFKYVDDNMLHFVNNDTQWGMMIYGYLYWSAHVLLFDLVFYCGTFFITLFKNIVDKLGGVAE